MMTLALIPSAPSIPLIPMAKSELWQRLRQARKFADQSQQQLADACGVTRGAIALWEAAEPEHRTKPTTDHLLALAKATGVPIEWLLNDAADLNELWRLTGEFGAPPLSQKVAGLPVDVLPDLRQGEHLFLFAQTPEQIAAKLAQLAQLAPDVRGHLVLIGGTAQVHVVATPTDALSTVVQLLTQRS